MTYMEEARISGLPGCVSVLTILYGSPNDLNLGSSCKSNTNHFYLKLNHTTVKG